MFEKLTKHLFGRKTGHPPPDELIVDGEIIDPETGKPVCVRPASSPGNIPGAELPADAENFTVAESTFHTENFTAAETTSDEIGFQGDQIPEGYLIHLGAAGRADRTVNEYQYELRWWNNQKPMERITWRDIEKKINKMNPATARRKIAVLRSYARWQLREGFPRLHTEVGRVLPPKIPGRIPKDRGSEEFKKLSKQAAEMCRNGDRRGIWIGLMLCCGLRISEIEGVELSSEQNIKVIGKGNKERLLPAPGWLYAAVAHENNRTWRRKRHLIWKELNNMGINKPHSLRHTYASELIRCGFLIEEVRELLGHTKLDTTLIYAKIQLPDQVTERLGVEYG